MGDVHTWIDFLKMLMEQIESYKECCVYNDMHIIVCFETEKDEMNIYRTLNTQRTKRR